MAENARWSYREHLLILDALKVTEWSGQPKFAGVGTCPCCGKSRSEGHSPSCVVGRAIAVVEKGARL